MEPQPLHRQRSKVRFSLDDDAGAPSSNSSEGLTLPLLPSSEDRGHRYEQGSSSSGYAPPDDAGVGPQSERQGAPSPKQRQWEEDSEEERRPPLLPAVFPHTHPPHARQPQRTESLWMGDDWRYKQKLSSEWAPLQQMESLDYDVVDNRVLRELGRHRGALGKMIVTVLIGLTIGTVAFLIEAALAALTKMRLRLLALDAVLPFQYTVGLYISSGVIMAVGAGLVTVLFSPAAAGAGVALVMTNLNGINVPRLLETQTMFGKIASLLLAVPSGLPIGPEGPLVHIGACIASFFSRQHNFDIKIRGRTLLKLTTHMSWFDLFYNDHDRRDFLSCGAAAGLAAAFGAPVGGVLFALEEASSFWNPDTTWRCIVCTSMATFVLTVMHGGVHELGAPGLIQLGDQDLKEFFTVVEVGFFALQAVIFGVLGAGFNAGFAKLLPYRMRSKRLKVAEIAGLVFLCNVIAVLPLFFPSTLGRCFTPPEGAWEDIDVVQPLQLECPNGQYNDLAVLLMGPREASIKLLMEQDAGKLFFCPLSLALQAVLFYVTMILASDLSLPSGLFMPCIFLGATLGALQGLGFQWLCAALGFHVQAARIHPGLYALVGGTAMLAGVFRSAISLVVIMLEGTGNVQYLLPLLVAVAVAKSVGNYFNISIYDMQIKKKRFPFLHDRLKFKSRSGQRENAVTCEQIMATKVMMLSEHEEVMVVEDALRSTHNGFPVVHTTWSRGAVEHHLRGFVTRHQLLTLLSRRELVAADTLRTLPVGLAHGSHPTGARAGGSLTGLAAMAAPTPITAEHAEIDSAMRTFFHRHSFYNRHTMTGPAIVDRLGLTPEDRRMYVDLGPYMNIAPMTVQMTCSWWKAYSLFRKLGLRHLPVVDDCHRVRGILTRKDFHVLEAH